MLEIGSAAPDFSLEDTSRQTHRLADSLARGPAILAFFKADCAACHLTFPYLERLYQSYPGPGWQMWGICQHPARAAQWFAKTNGVTFPLLIDEPDFRVSRLYDPVGTPTVFLLDCRGRIREAFTGFAKSSANRLADHLAELLGATAVVVAPPDDGKPSFRPG
jgi:peroxiredoxin